MAPLKHNNGGNGGGFGGMREEDIHARGPQRSNKALESIDLRGHMQRLKRMMADSDAGEFPKTHRVAHVGTADAQGWPYMVPLVYIYEGGGLLYLHTGNH